MNHLVTKSWCQKAGPLSRQNESGGRRVQGVPPPGAEERPGHVGGTDVIRRRLIDWSPGQPQRKRRRPTGRLGAASGPRQPFPLRKPRAEASQPARPARPVSGGGWLWAAGSFESRPAQSQVSFPMQRTSSQRGKLSQGVAWGEPPPEAEGRRAPKSCAFGLARHHSPASASVCG